MLAALLFYIPAVIVVVRDDQPTPLRRLLLIVGFAIAFRLIMVFTQPVLSDDMYRYVWDGRVQAQGINPYALPPGAPELSALRDDAIWPLINRKWAVTIYPAATQITFAALWRIWPDSVRWFQIAMTGGTIVAGILLMALAKALGRPAGRALIFLWCPAVVFETAHSAHVDGLVLIFIVAAWLARAKGRDGWTGIWLGVATAMKLLPVMLAPALWRPRDAQGRRRSAWAMPLAVVAIFAITYVPYLSLGKGVIGYLPIYFTERGSASPHALLGQISPALRVPEGPARRSGARPGAGGHQPVLRAASCSERRAGDPAVHLAAGRLRAADPIPVAVVSAADRATLCVVRSCWPDGVQTGRLGRAAVDHQRQHVGIRVSASLSGQERVVLV